MMAKFFTHGENVMAKFHVDGWIGWVLELRDLSNPFEKEN